MTYRWNDIHHNREYRLPPIQNHRRDNHRGNLYIEQTVDYCRMVRYGTLHKLPLDAYPLRDNAYDHDQRLIQHPSRTNSKYHDTPYSFDQDVHHDDHHGNLYIDQIRC